MERVTKIIVKRRYSPMRGMTREVDGMVSVITRRNTVRERRTEIQRVTCWVGEREERERERERER